MISTIPIFVILVFFKTPTHVVPIKKIIKLSVFFTVLGIVLIIIGGYIESNISYVDIR
nr:bacC [Enterococcus faecalis]